MKVTFRYGTDEDALTRVIALALSRCFVSSTSESEKENTLPMFAKADTKRHDGDTKR